MLKKIIGFIDDVGKGINAHALDTGCGGSETWIIKLAYQFIQRDYHVIIFSNVTAHEISSNHIEYVPVNLLVNRIQYQHFDHIFIMRRFTQSIIDMIKNANCCDHLYLVAHDIRFWKNGYDNKLNYIINDENNVLSYDRDIASNEWYKDHIHNIFFMSDFHKQFNEEFYPNEFCKIIGNGIDINEIDYTENERDNNMLWSSCYERGLEMFVDKIMPFIKERIPEFKLYCASYNENFPDKYNDREDIINLGSLNKVELYNEMKKHKAWFLPLSQWETFCITVLEQILNNVNISIQYKYGIKTSLKYFKSLCLGDADYENEEYCKYVANDIVDKIINYDSYGEIREILRSYVSDNYSWEAIANKIHSILIRYEA